MLSSSFPSSIATLTGSGCEGAAIRRLLTVLAWGRNLEGQAGVEGAPLVPRATPVLELLGQHITALAASKLTSAAVLANGGVDGSLLCWGDGSAGKLGLGHTSKRVAAPAVVQSLVGRATIVSAALGDQHSLFLDDLGRVWSCGENKEGQCGLGTPLEVLAEQRYATLQLAQRVQAMNTVHAQQAPTPLAALGSDTGSAFARRLKSLLQQSQSVQGGRPRRHALHPQNPLWATHQHQTAAQAAGIGSGGETGATSSARAPSRQWAGVGGGGGGGDAWPASAPAAALTFGGHDLRAQLMSSGAQPGQQTVPARLGSHLHPLASLGRGSSGGVGAWPVDASTHDGSSAQPAAYVQVAAGRHVSVAIDADGHVWAWGACFSGCLGASNSWVSSPQRLDGEVAAVVEAEGGAVQVAVGGTFCLALTRSGRVIIYGTPPGPPSASLAPGTGSTPLGLSALLASSLPRSHGHRPGGSAPRLAAGRIPGLPPITAIAAGQQHALLSDGHRVWMIGRSFTQTGTEAMAAAWDAPVEVLDTGSSGVAALRAGTHSSAVVTGDGELWMWGRLMDAEYARALLSHTAPEAGFGAHDLDQYACPESWAWPGFGASEPTRVASLGRSVVDVALGGWHALALVK